VHNFNPDGFGSLYPRYEAAAAVYAGAAPRDQEIAKPAPALKANEVYCDPASLWCTRPWRGRAPGPLVPPQHHLLGTQDPVWPLVRSGAPGDDSPLVHVEDEGDVNDARPGSHVGGVRRSRTGAVKSRFCRSPARCRSCPAPWSGSSSRGARPQVRSRIAPRCGGRRRCRCGPGCLPPPGRTGRTINHHMPYYTEACRELAEKMG
jgi:hypothetical protein